ncbi:MAG: 1-deoxy-D-xylulose-5-phosphate reductoisomerase [Pseudomonadota bacterium]
MTRTVSIFGSTGSIGQQTVDLIQRDRENFDVFCLSGASNIALLAEQAQSLRPKYVVTASEAHFEDLKQLLSDTDVQVLCGREALLDLAREPVDWAISAIVGFAGLEVSLAIAANGKTLALANKESLVCGGPLLRSKCDQHGTVLMPVDSEHSALFQAMVGEDRDAIDRVIITASGGPFRSWTREAMAGVTPAQAANHPKWSMGLRISIDSATLFNKALEVIEAKELFDFDPSQIEVIIHPQSTIHSLIGFRDQALMAHMGVPDMRGAIGYALYHPVRAALPVEPLDLAALGRLDFEAPDHDRFPALKLAYEVMERGGLTGAVLNGAKEAAMNAFLDDEICFLDMAALVERALHDPACDALGSRHEIDAIIAADKWSREFVALQKGTLR